MPSIGFIIPTYNEEKTIAAALSRITKLPGNPPVVVSDGGSTDKTLAIATSFGVIVCNSGRGRGHQLNEGTKHLSTDFIAFVHADTYLPSKSYEVLINSLSDICLAGGAFLLKFTKPGSGLKFIALTANLRSLFFKIPYGDQVIFVKNRVLKAIGGVPELPLFEDVELVKGIKKYIKKHPGLKFRIIRKPVLTSGRRYRKKGVILTTVQNKLFWLMYYCGTDINKIAEKYYS